MRALDNTGKNIFIGKYNRNEPYFYIPWDLNGSFGMTWNGLVDPDYRDILSNGLYDRLIYDQHPDGFLENLETRWATLRSSLITVGHLTQLFNDQFDYLNDNGVYERESMAWDDSRNLFLEFSNNISIKRTNIV